MEIVEITGKSDEKNLDSIILVASKSKYINLSMERLKYYAKDERHKVFIIREGEETKGFLIYFALFEDIDVEFIGTYPNGKGYGGELLSRLFKEAKNKGVKSVKLDLNENNEKAKKFYIKNGFEIIARRKKYYDRGDDALIMEKRFFYD